MDIPNSILPTQPTADSRNSAEAGEFMKEIEGTTQQNDVTAQDLENAFEMVAISFLQPIIMDTINLINEDPE